MPRDLAQLVREAGFVDVEIVAPDQEAFEPVTTQVDVDRGQPSRLEPTR
jgi:hypothetical protein